MKNLCAYDNPTTGYREYYQAGRLISRCTKWEVIGAFIPAEEFLFRRDVGRWKPEQVFGDKKALPKKVVEL
jgi:hypothetical protein